MSDSSTGGRPGGNNQMRGASESVRALLLTRGGEILLMRIAGLRVASLWITPGGRRQSGETAHAALLRELREELGLELNHIGPELWTWENVLGTDSGSIVERERVFLIETERFEPDTAGMEAAEQSVFREFRWWSAEEIARSNEMFVPPGFAALLGELLRGGPPQVVRVVEGVR